MLLNRVSLQKDIADKAFKLKSYFTKETYLKPKTMTLEESLGHSHTVK